VNGDVKYTPIDIHTGRQSVVRVQTAGYVGKKTWTKWGLNPRPHATELNHELAKQARYHCAIRPMLIIDEVKDMYGRFTDRLSATVHTLFIRCWTVKVQHKPNQEVLDGSWDELRSFVGAFE
jgi:hypothetical protein